MKEKMEKFGLVEALIIQKFVTEEKRVSFWSGFSAGLTFAVSVVLLTILFLR